MRQDLSELNRGEDARKSGGYMFRWSDTTGRHSIYGRTLKELRQKETALNLIPALFDKNLNARNLAFTGKESRRIIFDKYVRPFFYNTRIADITEEKLKEYKNDILNLDLSDKRTLEIFALMQSLFDEFYGKPNFANSVFRNTAFHNRSFIPSQTDKALLLSRTDRTLCGRAVRLSLMTDLKIAEILALTMQDINKNEVKINKAIDFKGKKRIQFTVSRRLILQDSTLLVTGNSKIIKSEIIDGVYGFVFVTGTGSVITKKTVNNYLRILSLKSTELPVFTCEILDNKIYKY